METKAAQVHLEHIAQTLKKLIGSDEEEGWEKPFLFGLETAVRVFAPPGETRDRLLRLFEKQNLASEAESHRDTR